MSANATVPLALEDFVPYRLSILANRVSRGLSRLYAGQFGLTIPQWRVMAVLGSRAGLSADAVCKFTEMDKVAVSRAVNGLASQRYLHRQRDATDRRRSVLRLSAAGQRLYARIIPFARQYEADLLASLSASDRAQIRHVLDVLEAATAESAA